MSPHEPREPVQTGEPSAAHWRAAGRVSGLRYEAELCPGAVPIALQHFVGEPNRRFQIVDEVPNAIARGLGSDAVDLHAGLKDVSIQPFIEGEHAAVEPLKWIIRRGGAEFGEGIARACLRGGFVARGLKCRGRCAVG